ncbi:hypothetical protein BDF21DRAFT_433874 [Thamnidium elegans]|nr:hypothetical protein BDF21DRAFT_433874 [Thamnidium elegans]
MIQNTDHSLPCNFENELIPPPLCQNTCFEWVQSVSQITNNPRVCSDSIQRNNTLLSFQDQCNTWEGFNGTVTENCISGIANEPYTCGFGANNFRIACHYCKNNPEDGCCQNVENCNHPLSKGAIAGIVLGSISFVAIILLIIYLTCHKRKNPIVNPFQFMSASAAGSSTTQPEIKQQIPLELQPTITTPTIVSSSSSSSVVAVNHEFYVVIHSYTSQIPDELQLSPGDIICLALHFDDGWALGFNVTTGLKGAFPLVCISLAPADSLDQLLNMQSDPIPRTLSVQQQQQQHKKPTVNTNFRHSIPKRSVSSRSKYDYIEPESPSSPTLHTPFFKHTI